MTYKLMDGVVVRDDGAIAVMHRTSNPTAMRIEKTTYQWSAKHNVSLSWISPEHLDVVLMERARICCGQTSKKFFLATIINVNLHETGHRNGNP
jgi:hypothetical protein